MSFQRFHISKKGDVVVCRAPIGKCPLDGEHFERKDLAYNYLADQYENFIVPITKDSIKTIYRVGNLEIQEARGSELNYVISELDNLCPNPSQSRGGGLYFTVSKRSSRRWRNKFFSFNSYMPEEAVEATIDPETTLVYNIHHYERVSGKLGNLWLHYNQNSDKPLGITPEVPEKLKNEIEEYWKSGITVKELWRRVAEGEIKEEELENYEVFVSPDRLISSKVFKKGLDYSKP